MTRQFLLLATTLVSVVGPGLLRAYDFKGIEIGTPADLPLINETISAPCEPGLNLLVCNGLTTVAGWPARANIVVAMDGIVQRIELTFGSDMFSKVEFAALAKFDKPTATEQSELQNRMGATFAQIEHTWRDKDGNVVILKKYAGTLDESSLYFGSPADLQLYEELAKEDLDDI